MGAVGIPRGGPGGAITAALLLLALFACILLHEFGHILMARRFGVRTPDVILLPIGGVARLERIPDEPRQELLIALAGPAVTLLIAGPVFASLLRLTGGHGLTVDQLNPRRRRSWISCWYQRLPPAVQPDPRVSDGWRPGAARPAGQPNGAGAGHPDRRHAGTDACRRRWALRHLDQQPLLVLIAFFVFLGASAEAEAVETRAAGDGLQVSQMMVTNFRTIPVHATLADAVDLLLSGEQREFPVVDNNGRIEGILTRDNLIRGLSTLGPAVAVAEAMTPGVPVVQPTLGFREALERLRSSRLPALPVVDPAGALVGLLTSDNITDLLLVQRAGPDGRAAARARS